MNLTWNTCRAISEAGGFSENQESTMNVEYDTLLELIEHLKSTADISTNRTKNWKTYCIKNTSKLEKYNLYF